MGKIPIRKNLGLEKTEEDALCFIREYEPPEGFYLGFSGGKDSIVVYDLVKKAGVKFKAYYSDTGIEPPELIGFIKRNYQDVEFLKPNYKRHRSFFGMVPLIGAPNIFRRWC